ncbi:unnamed protein product [Mesocestoides corti]|uniref:PKS_ER domain-containing protein n=1 Tax=Mesocestoides corti TaxID=53468 RepID=A0A0R3UBG8_MESCO|nr:unnamed protein product [Mesocestoides corti]
MINSSSRKVYFLLCRFGDKQMSSIPKEMRAWEIHKYEPTLDLVLEKELKLTTTRRPLIKAPRDLVVRTEAASVNPIDGYTLTGYGSKVLKLRRCLSMKLKSDDFPFTPGRDFAGVVVESGPEATTNFPPGTPVMGAFMAHMSSQGSGCLAEYIRCSSAVVARRPDKLDPVDAAAVSYAGLTAWSALKHAGLDPAEGTSDGSKRVLVTAATGAVGAIAAQLARIAGASYVAVTCLARVNKEDMKTKLGVDDVILVPELPSVSDTFDVIIDCVRPEILKDNIEHSWPKREDVEIDKHFPLMQNLSSNPGSRYVSVNPPLFTFVDHWGLMLGVGASLAPLFHSKFHSLFHQRTSSPLRWALFEPNGKRLEMLADWVVQGRIHVPIEKVFPFDQVPEALRKMAGRGNNGKIVVKFD